MVEENVETALQLLDLKMEKLESKIPEQLYAQNQEMIELSAKLKSRIQFYREENAKLELLYSKLKLGNEELNVKLQDILSEIGKYQEKFESNDSSASAITLSHAHYLRKHGNYLSKLKICIKMYINLNEKLSKELKFTKWELDHSKNQIKTFLTITDEELEIMEARLKRYEKELLKFEKKYPWLKDPELNLPNINKETSILLNLREEKEKLLKELSVYHNLKPDLQEASKQLAKVKAEHEDLNKLLLTSTN